MMLLPRDVGPLTLVKKIGSSGVSESFAGTMRNENGETKEVVIRRILPFITEDLARLTSLEARVKDLIGFSHEGLVKTVMWLPHKSERFVIQERLDTVDLQRVISWCKDRKVSIPTTMFLNIASQICSSLEALHAQSGSATGCKNILHLGLRPASILLDRHGKVTLGGYAFTRSPSALPGGSSGPVQLRIEYLSPEQTKSTEQLGPQSDIFSLGAVLYEMLALKPLFKESSKQRTIERIRRADVTAQMMETKRIHPGLDKILFRALSIRQEHRYRRAFVLREDLRGLMATHSFAKIEQESANFLSPFFSAENSGTTITADITETKIVQDTNDLGLKEAIVREWTDEEPTDASIEDTNMSSQKPLYPPNAASSNVGFVSGSTPKASSQTDNTEFVPVEKSPRAEPSPPPPIMETPKMEAPKMDFSDLPDIDLDDSDDWNPTPKGPNKMAIIVTAVVGIIVLFVALPSSDDQEPVALEEVATVIVEEPPIVMEPIVEEVEEEVVEEEVEEVVAAAPVRRQRQNTYTPPETNYSRVAYYPEPTPEPDPELFEEEELEIERIRTDIEMYVDAAHAGDLGPADVRSLEAIGQDDESYTQSRALLLINAESNRNARNVKLYLDQLFQLDENRYNPVFLSKSARWSVNNGNYSRASADARRAEQHWARIPPSLVFETKTEIFEVQAAALQGLFYESEDDLELLDKALRGWNKYIRHVEDRRSDLVEHASEQIRSLEYARSRLE